MVVDQFDASTRDLDHIFGELTIMGFDDNDFCFSIKETFVSGFKICHALNEYPKVGKQNDLRT